MMSGICGSLGIRADQKGEGIIVNGEVDDQARSFSLEGSLIFIYKPIFHIF